MNIREVHNADKFGNRTLLHIGLTLALMSYAGLGMAEGDADAQPANDQNAQSLEGIVVSAPDYVPRESNAAAKMNVPLIETPQSITVIPRDQIDLLDWQNLSQVVRYTSGVIGENYGPDPRYDWLTLRGFYPPEYVDGLQAPIGSVANVGVDLYGFQRVEVLKGPSSTLYGLSPPGGIVNLTSRRPEAQFSGEGQLQFGSYSDVQVAGDVTGPLNDEGSVLGRVTALYFDKGTQTNGVDTNRGFIAPSLTWIFTPNTNVTFLSYFQHDDVYGDGGGFLPSYGVIKPNPLGKVPTDTNLGDTDYNHFKRDQYGVGWDFNHQFNDTWRFEQNLKYFSSEVKILQVYGAGLVDANNDGVPDDYHTVNRYNFPFNENTKSFNVDNRVEGKINGDTVQQRVLFGLDYRRYTEDSEFGFACCADDRPVPSGLRRADHDAGRVDPVRPGSAEADRPVCRGLDEDRSLGRHARWSLRPSRPEQFRHGRDRRQVLLSRRPELRVRQRRCAVRVVFDVVPAGAGRGLQRQRIQAKRG